jgi:type I restriction enzyme M protein
LVERPLRLNFQVSPERIARFLGESGLQGLAKSKKKGAAAGREVDEGRALLEKIVVALKTISPSQVTKNREAFEKILRSAFQNAKLDVPLQVFKSLMSALSERDETADICTDSKGRPEPDPDLRDSESVPLKEDIQAYFRREVLPHAPDAWIDETKTKIGYEIPFTRHFYKYKTLRPLTEIEADIQTLETEIQKQLREVFG